MGGIGHCVLSAVFTLVVCKVCGIPTTSLALTTSPTTSACQPNYYGANCAVYCKDSDDGTNGHYSCDSQGNKVCREGFTDTHTDCKNPNTTLCSRQPCMNGASCVNGTTFSFSCRCAPAYTGRRCETVLPSTTHPQRTATTSFLVTNGTNPTTAKRKVDNTEGGSNTPVIVGASVGGVLAVMAIVVTITVIYKNSRKKSRKSSSVSPVI